MEFLSLFDAFAGGLGDEILIWAVAAITGCIGLIALVNVFDMFIDNNEAG